MGIATRGHQVEGEESQTAEEINVRALLPKGRGAHFHLDLNHEAVMYRAPLPLVALLGG